MLVQNIRLDKIWQNVNKEIEFFTKPFDQVPRAPGIYAWFFPLRITTKNINDFIKQVNIVFNYDVITKSMPHRNHIFNFPWQTIPLKLEIRYKYEIKHEFVKRWNELVKDEENYNELRKIIMRASIFMPPLYVGKAKDLFTRCWQHINGSHGSKDFHNRYESFAKENKIHFDTVNDLLFVCLRTKKEGLAISKSEDLVEEIMKVLSKPKYSKQ